MLDRIRHSLLVDVALRVQTRFTEVQGPALANGIALQTFLSLFPIVVVAVSVVGFLAAGDPDFASSVIDGLDLDGEVADTITTAIERAESSRRASSIIGFAGLAISALNLVTALQRASDAAWQTTGKGLRDKLRALALFGGVSAIFLASMALGALGSLLPVGTRPATWLVGFAVNTALFLWTFSVIGRLRVPWRERLPGAALCAVGFELLKVVGGIAVPRMVESSSSLYGPLGIVFALLAWLAILGRLIVYGTVLNVVRFEDRHGTVSVPIDVPRAAAGLPVAVNRAGAVVERQDAPG